MCLLCAGLAGCTTAVPVSSQQSQASASGEPAPTATFEPFPSASGSPPFTPPPVGTTPEPSGLTVGAPAFAFSVPSGYSVDLESAREVDLTSANGAEKLTFAVDSAAENLSHPLSTMQVGGATGYVIERGADAGGYGYSEVVIVSNAGVQYEAECIGYSGYDASLLTSGCGSFLGSIAFSS
ncbi:MAG: hypothetical protein JOY68_08050 [Candidatus Dormibacteraeota bacterium]|nr:hypothetical protein [Candidatus Dormibacteraeota bacterium]